MEMLDHLLATAERASPRSWVIGKGRSAPPAAGTARSHHQQNLISTEATCTWRSYVCGHPKSGQGSAANMGRKGRQARESGSLTQVCLLHPFQSSCTLSINRYGKHTPRLTTTTRTVLVSVLKFDPSHAHLSNVGAM